MQYDAIVIGSGNGGLEAASRLSQLGFKVLLAEQNDAPGGCASSFKRGRFEFETALHELCDLGSTANPGTFLWDIFNDLGVAERIDWRAVPDAFRAISTAPGELGYDVRMPFGREAFADAMEEACPGSRKSMRTFYELMDDTAAALDYSNKMLGRPDDAVMKKEHGRFLRFAPYSTTRVLDAIGMPRRAQSILSTYWSYLGTPCDRLAFLHYAIMVRMYLDPGAYIPATRSHEISLALTDRIRELGGEVWLSAPVEKIHVKNGAVCGARVDDEDISCKAIISNAMPHAVYGSLIDNADVPSWERKKANARRFAVSGFVVYLGLDATAEELGIEDYSVFISHTGDSTADFKKLSSIEKNDLSIFNCLNIVVPECSPKGTSIVYGTSLYQPEAWNGVSAHNYAHVKEEVAARFIADYEKTTGISLAGHIEEIETAAPPTFARYLGTPQGAIYGYLTADWDNMLPRLRTMYEGKGIRGLRFTGGHTEWSSGFNSAYTMGNIAANIMIPYLRGQEA